ncbi:MAG TPA: chlorite dismutase family protein [Candidatus Janibacter merdipullorum]|nr:chlorite dismutase family protein [Candidatus Janibacter merdipullorum]
MSTRPAPAKPTREQLEAINSSVHYAMFSAFALVTPLGDEDRRGLVEEVEALFAELTDGGVRIRGVYDVGGLRADADLLIWWHADDIEQLQDAYKRFLRTGLGAHLEPVWSNAAVHRQAEFNRSHVPAFMAGEEPRDYVCVYPFVRSYDWYVLEDKERRFMLAEHGAMAKDYPDVRANTIPAFALGDYEWILAFEADELHRIVDLMRELRASKARLHVREEIPFFTGPRVSVSALVDGLR